MEIKNLNLQSKNLMKVLKQKGVALLTGAVMAVSPVAYTTTKVEAASYNSYENVTYYYSNNVKYEVMRYLDKDTSSTNLKKLLSYYDNLYDYINNGKYVQNTYYRNLRVEEQNELNYQLNNWGNEIYNKYRTKSYFKETCKSVLGFVLTYKSTETGYDYDHKDTMKHYQETLSNKFDTFITASPSQSSLTNALKQYNSLVKFIEGTARSYGYIYSELTITEQQDINRLIENWTDELLNKYETYSYYRSNCISTVGWTVNNDNLYKELGKYMNTNGNYYPGNNNNNNYYPGNNDNNYYPGNNNNYYPDNSNNNYYPGNNQYNPNNNSSTKDWHQSYEDPSINTSGGIRDYVPEYINGSNYYNDYNNNYNYNNYNRYYQNNSDYTEDYAPEYIYKR
mgnify:CR=1 FL=1